MGFEDWLPAAGAVLAIGAVAGAALWCLECAARHCDRLFVLAAALVVGGTFGASAASRRDDALQEPPIPSYSAGLPTDNPECVKQRNSLAAADYARRYEQYLSDLRTRAGAERPTPLPGWTRSGFVVTGLIGGLVGAYRAYQLWS